MEIHPCSFLKAPATSPHTVAREGWLWQTAAWLSTTLLLCAQLLGLSTSSQMNPTPNLCLESSIFRQSGALQNQTGTNRQIFMGLSRCRQGKLKFSVQVVYTRLM